MDEPGPPTPPPDWLLRVVLWLLAAVIGSQILAIFLRGFGCVYWGTRCSEGDFKLAMDMFAGLTATVIALLFAVIRK